MLSCRPLHSLLHVWENNIPWYKNYHRIIYIYTVYGYKLYMIVWLIHKLQEVNRPIVDWILEDFLKLWVYLTWSICISLLLRPSTGNLRKGFFLGLWHWPHPCFSKATWPVNAFPNRKLPIQWQKWSLQIKAEEVSIPVCGKQERNGPAAVLTKDLLQSGKITSRGWYPLTPTYPTLFASTKISSKQKELTVNMHMQPRLHNKYTHHQWLKG